MSDHDQRHSAEKDAGVIAALTAHLDPCYCSDAPGDGTYVRWVRCRCGWESVRSETRVNAPDMRQVHAEHIVATGEAWDDEADCLVTCACEADRENGVNATP